LQARYRPAHSESPIRGPNPPASSPSARRAIRHRSHVPGMMRSTDPPSASNRPIGISEPIPKRIPIQTRTPISPRIAQLCAWRHPRAPIHACAPSDDAVGGADAEWHSARPRKGALGRFVASRDGTFTPSVRQRTSSGGCEGMPGRATRQGGCRACLRKKISMQINSSTPRPVSGERSARARSSSADVGHGVERGGCGGSGSLRIRFPARALGGGYEW
jgi:hypothetical protein